MAIGSAATSMHWIKALGRHLTGRRSTRVSRARVGSYQKQWHHVFNGVMYWSTAYCVRFRFDLALIVAVDELQAERAHCGDRICAGRSAFAVTFVGPMTPSLSYHSISIRFRSHTFRMSSRPAFHTSRSRAIMQDVIERPQGVSAKEIELQPLAPRTTAEC